MTGTASAIANLPHRVVVLQGLDKVTATITEFEVRVDEEGHFGTLRIVARACFEAPATEAPESAAFLQVFDEPPGRPAETAFSGWMFASSPSISALEHPVFDLRVLDCLEPAGG